MNPIISPIRDPTAVRNATTKTHMKTKASIIMENANPCMKYFEIVLRVSPLVGMVDASEDIFTLLIVTVRNY
jgi:hypothetical protein